jgi:hypothetical protein
MVSSTSLILYSFLQSLRPITGLTHKLRAFILRCLLSWPRIFRNLRKAWSRYFPTSSTASDGKKTGGNIARPPSPRMSWKREECSAVCASRAFERGADERSLGRSLSRFSDRNESIQLGPVIGRSPDVPHSPSSSYPPSVQDSPRSSANPLPTGNANNSSSSLQPEAPLRTVELILHQSSTPGSWASSRAPSRQFTGARSRSRSRQPSPSPSRSLFRRHHFSRPVTPSRDDIEVPTHPAVMQRPHGFPEVSAHSSTGITFRVEQPSPPGSPATSNSSPSRLSLVRDQAHGLPTRSQLPSSTESVNSSAGSLRSRGHSPFVLVTHRNAHHSQGSIRTPSLGSQSIQAPNELPFAFPEVPLRIQISATAASNTQPRRLLKPMHSEKVSRYLKKGDVCVLPIAQANCLYRDMSSGQERIATIPWRRWKLICNSVQPRPHISWAHLPLTVHIDDPRTIGSLLPTLEVRFTFITKHG